MSFTIFDTLIASIIILSSFFGFYKGLINLLIDIIGLVVVVVATIIIAPYIKIYLLPYFKHEFMTTVISYVVIYIILSLIVNLFLSKVAMIFSILRFSVINSLLGGIMGVIRGGLLSVIVFGVSFVIATGNYLQAKNLKELSTLDEEKYPEWMAKSHSTPYLANSWNIAFALIPDSYLESVVISRGEEEEEGEKDLQKEEAQNP